MSQINYLWFKNQTMISTLKFIDMSNSANLSDIPWNSLPKDIFKFLFQTLQQKTASFFKLCKLSVCRLITRACSLASSFANWVILQPRSTCVIISTRQNSYLLLISLSWLFARRAPGCLTDKTWVPPPQKLTFLISVRTSADLYIVFSVFYLYITAYLLSHVYSCNLMTRANVL